MRKLKGFWSEVIEHVESELTIIVMVSKNAVIVKQSMASKTVCPGSRYI